MPTLAAALTCLTETAEPRGQSFGGAISTTHYLVHAEALDAVVRAAGLSLRAGTRQHDTAADVARELAAGDESRDPRPT